MASLNDRVAAAQSVGLPLIELEKHIDAAVALHGEIMGAIVAGRRKARLPLNAAQPALEELAIALPKLVAVRAAIHAAHENVRAVSGTMNLPPMSYGDYGNTPGQEESPKERREGRGTLRSIEAA